MKKLFIKLLRKKNEDPRDNVKNFLLSKKINK
jgi:hypothetical protein